MTDPGQFDKRPTLLSSLDIPDGSGGKTKTWVDGATVWAMRGVPRPHERLVASQRQTDNSVTITLRSYRDDVTSDMRIRLDGVTYQIIGTPFDLERKKHLVLECEEVHG